MDKISLLGLVFYGHHGVQPEEKKLGQRFIVDVELWGNFEEAGSEDNLDKAVDYSKVYELTRQIVEGSPRNLLEAVALQVCQQVLERFRRVKEVLVRIKKPQVPLEGAIKAATVEIHRKRETPD